MPQERFMFIIQEDIFPLQVGNAKRHLEWVSPTNTGLTLEAHVRQKKHNENVERADKPYLARPGFHPHLSPVGLTSMETISLPQIKLDVARKQPCFPDTPEGAWLLP